MKEIYNDVVYTVHKIKNKLAVETGGASKEIYELLQRVLSTTRGITYALLRSL